jgi:hypothetical protein
LLHTRAYVVHLFSWESQILNHIDDEGYVGYFLSKPCPCCNVQIAEVYVDRILTEYDLGLFEDEEVGLFKVAERLSLYTVHELVHWAGPNLNEIETPTQKMR